MTKAQKQEQEQAREELRKILKPGDTVYCGLKHVSRSGMQREIALYVVTAECGPRCVICGAEEWDLGGTCPDGEVHSVEKHAPKAGIRWITGYAATALGMRRGKRDGIVIGGCGMDMGFALVNSLSYALYGEGYKCLGKGAEPKCPSSYHVNHRDSLQCPGTRVHNPEGPDSGSVCYWTREHGRFVVSIPEEEAKGILGNPRAYVPVRADALDANLSELNAADFREGVGKKGIALAHAMAKDGVKPCPTCKGKGRVPNPEGKEKWDLVHKDGYALKSEWL
jgi:hypothetical protein